MSKIIHHAVRLRCDTRRAFDMFTVSELLASWLARQAEVEPVRGGKYELFWDPLDRGRNSTLGCRVTTVDPGRFLAFEWKGPDQFQHFMNTARPLTQVEVFFVAGEQRLRPCTEVHLIHSGWRDSAEWEQARQWFDRVWGEAFAALGRHVNGG
jgi:uncharacterized protein YndB with AHSA1/START domain